MPTEIPGGKGLHDHAPSVSGFIATICEQLAQGEKELTYESSGTRANTSAEELRAAFRMMNGLM